MDTQVDSQSQDKENGTNDTLDTVVENSEFQLLIHGLSEDVHTHNVTLDTTLLELRNMLATEITAPLKIIRIVYNGKWLRDDTKTVSELGLHKADNNTKINLVLGI